MEAKKTKKADLENKKSAFLEVGMVIALVAVIGLFSWSQSEKKVELMANSGDIIEQEVIDVTLAEEKPQDAKPVQTTSISDYINVVKNDAKIEQDLAFFDDFDASALEGQKFTTFVSKEEAVEEEIPVFAAEEMPMFQGKDINAFRAWCFERLVYPQIAQENGIQGKVTVSFVIERDGKLTGVKVLRGVSRELDDEAVRVIKSSPKWTPGKNHGRPVRVIYNMGVDFKLGNQ